MNPTGKVTFLFTDIEGSTKLAQDFPDSLPTSLDKHHLIVQRVIERNNGFTFEIVGDAFCCAFHKAEDAVRAAVDIQTSLSTEKWNDAVIKVRIGIHSGIAEWNGTRYVGYITLAQTSRVMSAAYGEQIIISNGTYELCKYSFANSGKQKISFRDLGERRLKDVIQPVRLFQVLSPRLKEDFPPLKTLDARPNNLPVQLSSFIGREKEISDITKSLEETRLITITGPGGIGKSRLAKEAGADMIDEFANGVWLVDFATISDTSCIELKIASALGLSETKNKNTTETIIDFLKTKEMLLILDNCEHLIEGTAVTAELLLRSCPDLKIMSAGREPLHIPGEKIYLLTSLALPDPKEDLNPEDLMKYEAIRLFNERALLVRTDFRIDESNLYSVAELCRRLDGIPLAIELAAARVTTFTAEKILEKINDRFLFLKNKSRTALPRQQTLKAMIDWSYELLNEKEKSYFRNLAVFKGGAILEAIEKVCSDSGDNRFEVYDILTGIVDKSLLKTMDVNDEIRFSMLETIRLYSMEKLQEEGRVDEIYEKYFKYFYSLTRGSSEKLTGADQKMWQKKYEDEIDNIRECLRWAMKHEPESALQMSIELGIFWSVRGSFSEGFKVLCDSMDIAEIKNDSLLGSAYLWKGFYKLHQGQYEQSEKYFITSVELLRSTNEEITIANSLSYLATIAIYKNELENAKKYQEECLSLRKKNNDKRGIAGSMNGLGQVYYYEKDYDKAKKVLEESLEIYKDVKDLRGIAANLGNIGKIEIARKNYLSAEKYLKECLCISKELGDIFVFVHGLLHFALVYQKFKHYERACLFLSFSKSLFDELEIDFSADESNTFYDSTKTLKSVLGEKKYEQIWNEGGQMKIDRIYELTIEKISIDTGDSLTP